MLMNLGSLVTISAHAPENYILIIFDNGVYEVTGAQLTLGSAALRKDNQNIDYATIARACGFLNVLEFDRLESWKQQAGQILAEPGPTFVVLKVAPMPGAVGPKSPGPANQRALKFMQVLSEFS